VWNLKNFELLKTLTEHQACVLCLTVKDQWFFSGSYDTSVKVWNLQNLQIVDTLQHNSKVEAIVATDKYIISGSTDSTIKVKFNLYHVTTSNFTSDLGMEESNRGALNQNINNVLCCIVLYVHYLFKVYHLLNRSFHNILIS
jgi:WD40 repeat protein